MEKFGQDRDTFESKIEIDNVDYFYEKKDGRWQLLAGRKIPIICINEDLEEQTRRRENFTKMYEETAVKWKLDDATIEHNEGILRDHPQYRELFKKWAMRWLRQKGFDTSKFTGEIDPNEGQLVGIDGRPSKVRLVNAVRNGREFIDEWIEMELRMSEGFIDITYNDERREELGIEPEYSGWWTADEL